ncbi:glycerophosphodiester phosphodiesterase [Coleofasciculus sp. F4-SAH-05]|uniref:glycerophosphodiester phosphodiesterase n=1 Tax=Coleofasciculus sp. F4-SAH-05 TaxID=3069525 RepID=UPI0032FCA8D4
MRSRDQKSRPLVIAHRGASGYRPEHTLAAYELAIQMGADYIEPDLVMTQDGVLMARHENEISGTTDVATRPEFRDRQTTKMIDGQTVTGWFTEDFTLAELKTLRVKERLPHLRSTKLDGLFDIPTLVDIIELVQRQSAATGRMIGIYPETKHPTYFNAIGISLEEPLVNILNQYGLGDRNSPVFIQSFETANLKALKQITDVSLVQLVNDTGQPYDFIAHPQHQNHSNRTYRDLITPQGLREIADYADAIGVNKRLIVPTRADGYLLPPTFLLDEAHAQGLQVHGWTFRNEAVFLAPDYQGNPELEYQQFYRLGIDGLFSDFPDTALQVARSSLGVN